MRLICYLAPNQHQEVMALIGTKAAEGSFLRNFECLYPPPDNIFTQEVSDSFNLSLDTGRDILLIDPTEYPAYEAIVTYCMYSRKIPVYVCSGHGHEKHEIQSKLIQDHPLLEIGERSRLGHFLRSFTDSGKLISFEGGDGVGKQTQTAHMKKKLEEMGHVVKTMDFPHDAAACGKLIRQVLRGDFGTIQEIHPILFASLYGYNRADMKGILLYWLRRGYIVLLDRYVEANYGHQLSKLNSEEEQSVLLNALVSFEHEWLGLPRSHIVLYLDLPPQVAASALALDTTRKALDIHESAVSNYKEKVRSTFLWCSEQLKNWRVVKCLRVAEIEGHPDIRLSVEEVHTLCIEHVLSIID
ncbi:thymidylate kinase-like protein [Perkinsela sp. CCAP 1560/4]|nr:thymidylate kinase-like protein [Perkinsela sp. CCAP 1560/4]|eukprot:KNH08982.1 thymidylate kinase-like protein [Perkinsela sp. CCAP 1560/4]